MIQVSVIGEVGGVVVRYVPGVAQFANDPWLSDVRGFFSMALQLVFNEPLFKE